MSLNQIMFIIVNYIEVVYLYITWRRLKQVDYDQLNIKNEFKAIVSCWIVFSVSYFFVVIVGQITFYTEQRV